MSPNHKRFSTFYREAVHTAERIGTTQTNSFGNQGLYLSICEEKTTHILQPYQPIPTVKQ